MTKHTAEALKKLQHVPPSKPQHSPAKHAIPTHGAKALCADDSEQFEPILGDDSIKHVQRAVGIVLHCAIALDNTYLMALSDIAAAQSKATKSTMDALKHLLDYLATHQKAETRHKENPIVLHAHSNGSYLSEPKARSRAAGYFFLSDNPTQP